MRYSAIAEASATRGGGGGAVVNLSLHSEITVHSYTQGRPSGPLGPLVAPQQESDSEIAAKIYKKKFRPELISVGDGWPYLRSLAPSA
jgi:hypothetical protein